MLKILLLLLLARPVMKSLFNFEPQLFEKLDFIVIDIFIVEDLEFFHPGFHLSSQPRVFLEQLGPPFRVLALVHLLNKFVEL